MKKQTAANNKFLKNAKKTWNSKIYKKTVSILNTDGIEKAIEYLQQFTKTKLTSDYKGRTGHE